MQVLRVGLHRGTWSQLEALGGERKIHIPLSVNTSHQTTVLETWKKPKQRKHEDGSGGHVQDPFSAERGEPLEESVGSFIPQPKCSLDKVLASVNSLVRE
jgi:hypothetical protein